MFRVFRLVAAGLVLALAATKVAWLVAGPPRVGHWRSAAHRHRYAEAYAAIMATLPQPDLVSDVATRFGTVHVIGWRGTAGGPPVVLLPGRSSGIPMWAENLPSWIGKRTVFAFDPLGDAGLSAQGLPLTSPSDQASWIAETIHALNIGPVHAVGHSFGGANAAVFAAEHPDLVATLTLIEPIMVVKPMPPSVYLWATLIQLPTPHSWRDYALARIGGTTVEEVRRRTPVSVMINCASSGYASALPMPKSLTDEQWRSLPMPVRLDIGGASDLAGNRAAADRVQSLLPHAVVKTWPGATHSLPMERHEELGTELAAFWNQS